jgi:hypothetical protein
MSIELSLVGCAVLALEDFDSLIEATLECPSGDETGTTVTLIVSSDEDKKLDVIIAVAVSFTATISVAESKVNESTMIVALAGLIEKTNNGASNTARII